jgi:hypothetical protein
LYALTGSYQDVHRNEVPKICWIWGLYNDVYEQYHLLGSAAI